MRRKRYRAVMSGILVVLMITALFVPVVAADNHEDESETTERSYQIVQGDQVIPVEPMQGDESVEEFYDYRHPHVGSRDNPSWGRSFSSMGTTDIQQDDTSALMLYEGPDGVSLVAVHDKYYEEQAEGTTGGSVSWTVSGLPEDGEWAVIDDEYGWLTENETKDDIFLLDSDHQAGAPGNDGAPPSGADALLSWVWLTGRSDGVAYRGLDQDVSMTIEPSFNSRSYHRYGDQRRADELPDRPDRGERYNGTIDDWQVIVPTEDEEEEAFSRVSLDSLNEPVDIRSTSSPPAPRSVSLENENIEPGETAQVTAVIENNGVDWIHDASFRVGDTELDSQTVTVPAGEERTVEFSQEFTEPGVYEIGVDDTQTTLTVGDPESTTNGDTDDSTESTDEQVPGFGPVTALVAVVAVTIVARRQAT
jgi:PGF-CTERM protein